jgi:hypothetical protein
MSSTLTTRKAAVQWLNKQGLYAASRDWNFGETVIAAAGRIEPTNTAKPFAGLDCEEIVAYRYMLCIHPDNDRWSVSDLSTPFPITKKYGTLEEATHEAARDLFEKLAGQADAEPFLQVDSPSASRLSQM